MKNTKTISTANAVLMVLAPAAGIRTPFAPTQRLDLNFVSANNPFAKAKGGARSVKLMRNNKSTASAMLCCLAPAARIELTTNP